MTAHLPLTASDQRSDEILASIRHIFVEKGFDGASMQDLARAAGMSVGNFYRYFASKSAIIEAMVRRDMVEMEQAFRLIINSTNPMHTLRETLRMRVEGKECADDGALWAEITAAAIRKPEIRDVVGRMGSDITRYMTAVFARASGLPLDEAQARYGAHAALIVMMVKASAMHRCETDVPQSDLTALILRTIDNTLDEIVLDDAKV